MPRKPAKKVVVLEKASTWGGSSKETDNFSVMGTKTQQAIYQGLAAQMKAAGQDEAAAQFEQMGALDPMVMRAQWKEKFYVKPNGGDVGELPNGEEGPRACAPIQPMLETLTACIPDAIDYMEPWRLLGPGDRVRQRWFRFRRMPCTDCP